MFNGWKITNILAYDNEGHEALGKPGKSLAWEWYLECALEAHGFGGYDDVSDEANRVITAECIRRWDRS
jgi:hypothetical protein